MVADWHAEQAKKLKHELPVMEDSQSETYGAITVSDGKGSLAIEAPLEAAVLSIHVREGEKLVKGSKVIILEAMKTEVAVTVPDHLEGKTAVKLLVKPRASVRAGQSLVSCE